MPSILFVCTANICRSPLAEGLFRSRVQKLPDAPAWQVASAGTWAVDGRPAHVNSQAVAAEWGVDITDHRSRNATAQLLAGIDLILTMEQGHKEALTIEFPALARRIFLLAEMTGARYDIADPIGRPLSTYQALARQLDTIFEKGMPQILTRVQEAAA